MSDWKEYRLGEIIDVRDGTHDSPKKKGIGKPLVTSKHIKGGKIDLSTAYFISIDDFDKINKRSKVDKWDVLFSMIGTIGETAIIKEEPDFAIKNVGLFKAKDEYTAKWIYYFFKSPQAQSEILSSLKGSTQQYISLTDLRNFPIIYPPIRVGWEIVQILSSLDDKIELNNKINLDLENLAQTLFKQWFIDYEFPNENGEPYKSSGGEMVDSELGEIPKGWVVIPISDVFDFLSGYPFKGESFSKSGNYGIVTIKNVQDGKFVQDTDNFIDDLPNKFPKNAILNIGDILMSLTGNVGRVCFVTKENCVLNQRVVKFKGKQENSNAFWYYFFRQTLVKELLISISKGTAQLNLSPIETKSLKFVLPKLINENLLASFTEIFNFEVACSIENIELTTLRDTLLPKLISGELEVSQIKTTS
jgi:type I restriction enzyme S subunit